MVVIHSYGVAVFLAFITMFLFFVVGLALIIVARLY